MLKNKLDYLYSSACENVNWLLNIRGKDLPNSPVINCKILITCRGKIFLFINKHKLTNFIKRHLKRVVFCEENKLLETISGLKNGSVCIDKNTCSIFEQNIIKSKFKIVCKTDPIYEFKSIKNSTEIKNTVKAHLEDGIALTKFLYWFKKNKKELTEKILKINEKLRKKSKNYLYPSFDTIAGSGPNGAIIHYKSNDQTNRKIRKNELLLIDLGSIQMGYYRCY